MLWSRSIGNSRGGKGRPQGSVLGIDLAQNLLTLARAKASARGLQNTNSG
jgi:ubiquinone/menaquinone biosynthesis C-methylase UbiE